MSDSTNDRNDLFERDPEPYYDDEWYDEWDDDALEERDDDDDSYYMDAPEMTLLEYMQFEKIPGWLIAIVSFYLRLKSAYSQWRVRNEGLPF